MQTGICLQKWDKYYFKGSALSPNGHIITYIIGKEITVENIFDQSFLYKIQTNYEGWRSELKFSHDNKYLHYIFLDSTHNILSYIIYHAESGTQIEKYQHQIEIHSEIEYEVDFNRSSLYIIENGKIIQLNIKTREVIKPFSGPSEEFDHFPIKSMAHDPNGKWLAGTYLGSHLALWKMENHNSLLTQERSILVGSKI
jgi:WD40 repeat protein